MHELLRGTPLQQVAPGIAYRAIRNRGTLGGSLAAPIRRPTGADHGRPGRDAGDRRPDGVRMPAQDYMQGAYTTGLREDELIAAVHVPEAGRRRALGYYKFCRKTGEFAEASCAAWFDAASKTARIAVGR